METKDQRKLSRAVIMINDGGPTVIQNVKFFFLEQVLLSKRSIHETTRTKDTNLHEMFLV